MNHQEIISTATALLTPELRRGRRGVKVAPARLGLEDGNALKSVAFTSAAAARGLAVFAGRDGRLRVVSVAAPTERDGKAALALTRERVRANRCRYCMLEEPTPFELVRLGKGPKAGSVHRQCLPAWKAWSAAADRYAASLAPSPIPADAGLVETVVDVAEQLLGSRRGWRGKASLLWKPDWAPEGAGMWVDNVDLFNNLILHDVGIHRELGRSGLNVWKGADGLLRLARNTTPSGDLARTLLAASARSCECAACRIDEYATGEPLQKLSEGLGGKYVHAQCLEVWLSWVRAAGAHQRAQAAVQPPAAA